MDDELKCRGFPEQVVLAVRSCFYETDMRRIIIEKDLDRITYHHRLCSRAVDGVGSFRISAVCNQWFNTLHLQVYPDDPDPDPVEGQDETDPLADQEEEDRLAGDIIKEEDGTEHYFGTSHTLTGKGKKRSAAFSSTGRSRRVGGPRVAAETKPLVCDIGDCQARNFNNNKELKEHLKSVHSLPKRGRKSLPDNLDLSEDPKRCTICDKEFTKKVFLTRHMRRHTASAQACHICGQMVKELQVHIKQRHTEKDKLRYFCEFCGKGFKGYSSHAFHIAGHTGERKYSCKDCGRNYRTSSEQKKCERAHQGLFKYNCSQCSYRTHQKNKFVRHLRTHTKSAPYRCPICEHRAARKDYLQKHIVKTHTELSLDEVESAHPNLYQIEEKVSLDEAGELVIEEERDDLVPIQQLDDQGQTTQMFIVPERFNDSAGERFHDPAAVVILAEGKEREQEWKIILSSDAVQTGNGSSYEKKIQHLQPT